MAFPISQELARPWVKPEILGSLPKPASNLLWVLTLVGQSCSTAELAELTAQSRQVVRQTLSQLAGKQLVFKVDKDRWVLAADFREQVAAMTRRSANVSYENYAKHGSVRLEVLLDHIGINPPAYNELLLREDLQGDPAIVLGWWWYYLTMDWPTNRAGLVIKQLLKEAYPPEEFLWLARVWPQVTNADRAEIEQMLWRNYSPSQISQTFGEIYPQLSAKVCVVLQILYESAPRALGF